jgi:hypothetical protein
VLYLYGTFLPPQDAFKVHQATHVAASNKRCAMYFMILYAVFSIFTLTASSVTQNVPPKPQHSSVRFNGINPIPVPSAVKVQVLKTVVLPVRSFVPGAGRVAHGSFGAGLLYMERKPHIFYLQHIGQKLTQLINFVGDGTPALFFWCK